MFEQNRHKNLYITTLYVTCKTFVFYELVRSTLLGQCCLTQPAGACLWFPQLN